LKDDLPKGVLDVCDFEIIGTGNNTISLVTKAIKLKEKWQIQTGRTVAKIWIVFDKDSFTLQSFNTAIQTCIANAPHVEAAWTNEAFELWYLLQFHFYNSGIGRKRYQDLIENNFREKGLANYKYKKNSTEMFSMLELHGSRENAIRNATNLERNFAGTNNYADQNSCTKVHHWIAELFGLEQVIQEENEQ